MTDITDPPTDLLTAATAAEPAEPAVRRGPVARARRRFATFRRTRPFWGAITLALGAYFVAQPLLGGTFAFYTTVGVRSITPLLLAGGMFTAAVIAVVLPAQRHFPAIVAIMLSIASLPLANLGGWLIGMVLGIAGAGLVFAWAPYSEKQLARFAAKDRARAERRALRKDRG